MAQANGKAANEPKVPGAGRMRPIPKQVATKKAGWINERVVFDIVILQRGRRTVAIA